MGSVASLQILAHVLLPLSGVLYEFLGSFEMEIKMDNLDGGEVIALLEEHLSDMYATSPPESVHALDGW